MTFLPLILLTICCIVLVAITIHACFTRYRYEKDLIDFDKAKKKKHTDLLIFIFFATFTIIPFILSFGYVSIIILGATIILCTLIHYGYQLLTGEIHLNEFAPPVFLILFSTIVILGGGAICYSASVPSPGHGNYKLEEKNVIETGKISTEKQFFEVNNFLVREEAIFVVLSNSDSPTDNKNYAFSIPSKVGVDSKDTEQIVLDSSEIAIKRITANEEPHYKLIETKYVYKREKDPLMKKTYTTYMYEVYISGQDITSVDLSNQSIHQGI